MITKTSIETALASVEEEAHAASNNMRSPSTFGERNQAIEARENPGQWSETKPS